MRDFVLLQRESTRHGDPKRAKALARFFKTGIGEYGHGDVFAGIIVPQARKIAKRYGELALVDITRLLRSKIHEQRLIALLILVRQFERGDEKTRKKIFTYYLKHTRYVNNWDLVDLSAPKIVGAYLLAVKVSAGVLERLASSKNLWERRIAIVATMSFIRAGRFAPTLALSKKLLYDTEDLIHKAVGWMLREVGKRNRKTLERFLEKNARTMPRTMLRYALERFGKRKRRKFLRK